MNKDIVNQKFYSANFVIQHTDSVEKELADNGIILIKDVINNETGLNIAKLFGGIIHNIDGNIEGITIISNRSIGRNIKNSYAFTKQALYPHTDRSPLKYPPTLLLNWCSKKSNQGGETLLVDALDIYTYLNEHYPGTTEILARDNAATFYDGIDSYTGAILTNKDNHISIRFRNDDCIEFSPEVKKILEKLYEAIDKCAIKIDFNKGEAYLIKNNRWLHGRTAFIDDREILRIHIQEHN